MELLQSKPEMLTAESSDRIRLTKARGVFASALNGNTLFIPALLAGRGLVGFAVFILPILVTAFWFMRMLLNRKGAIQAVGITIFIACVGPFLAAFSQGLWFFYFWCSQGLAWGFIACGRHKQYEF